MLGCLALTKIAVVPENNLKIGEEGGISCIIAGAQITWLTGAKLQILTQKAHAAMHCPRIHVRVAAYHARVCSRMLTYAHVD